MTLYIYRVGWTYPARNPITRSKSIKIPSCTRIPLGLVRPVDPTGQTGRLLPDRLQRLTGQTARAYRSDRSVLSNANFGRQHMPPYFFGKTYVPKNTLLDQNCLKAMINDTSAIFCAKGDKNYRPCLAFLQVDETICFGLQTFFMAIVFVGWTSTCCSIFS